MRNWLKTVGVYAVASLVVACLGMAGYTIYILVADTPAAAQQARAIDYVNASSGNVAAATATATLPSSGNRQQFITGFEITYGGATAGSCVTATVTGLLGGTESYIVCAPVGATVGGVPLTVQYTTPVPASYNTAIVVSVPSLGAGNTNTAVNLHGFILQQ